MFSKMLKIGLLSICYSSATLYADDHLTASTEGATVFIVSPTDGAVIEGSVTVKFGINGMTVAPAGTDKAFTGHHHLIIDAGLPILDEGIPADENYIHYGKGQMETTLELAPGEHTLQLLLGDMNHIPHLPAVYSSKITITVK